MKCKCWKDKSIAMGENPGAVLFFTANYYLEDIVYS